MNCRESRRLIAVSLYAELPAGERTSLDAHLRDCPDCRAVLGKTPRRLAEAFPEPADRPASDWEQTWEAVAARMKPPVRKSPRLRPRPAWAFAGLFLLAVFIAGYFVGRGGRGIPAGPPSPEAVHLSGFADSAGFLRDYAESLHPLLISWLYRSSATDPAAPSPLEREIVRGMLAQTRILRLLAERQGDPYLEALARDIETLLREIDSLRPDEDRLPERIVEWAEVLKLPVKVRLLAAPGSGV